MQILLGANETIIKIYSKNINIDNIEYFIHSHFMSSTTKSKNIYIPSTTITSHHRNFLLKWLYTIYTKKNKSYIPKLKELIIKRANKAIKIELPNRECKYISNKQHLNDFTKTKQTKSIKKYYKLDTSYTILGVTPQDDIFTLKKHYKRLAKEYHPDRVFLKDQQTINIYTSKFQNILQAYESLLTKMSA